MIETVRAQLMQTGQELVEQVIQWTPRVLLAVVMIVLAVVVARVVERIFKLVLERVKIDSLVQHAGIDQTLRRIGLRQSLEQFLPRLIYFLLLFLFARTGAEAMGLTAISSAIGTFLAYLPNLIAAVLILLLGSVAAQFAGTTVRQAAEDSGIDFASTLGNLVSALILFVIGMMALGQLQIETEMIQLMSAGMLAAFAIAFGLAFGLGSRDVVRSILAGFYARKNIEPGAEVEVGGERGTLRSITATQTLLEREGETVVVPNRCLLDEVVRRSD